VSGELSSAAIPADSSTISRSASTTLDRWALERLQRAHSRQRRFDSRDGFEMPSPAGPIATIRFDSRRAVLGCVWDSDLNRGEAYMSGAFDIRGDLLAVLEAIFRALPVPKRRAWWLWQPSNDVRTARDNVHRHYDLDNDFYRLWLDRTSLVVINRHPSTRGFSGRLEGAFATLFSHFWQRYPSATQDDELAYEPPEHPEVVVSGSGETSDAARAVIGALEARGYVGRLPVSTAS
jgi:hypothetical protein